GRSGGRACLSAAECADTVGHPVDVYDAGCRNAADCAGLRGTRFVLPRQRSGLHTNIKLSTAAEFIRDNGMDFASLELKGQDNIRRLLCCIRITIISNCLQALRRQGLKLPIKRSSSAYRGIPTTR